MGVKTHDKLMVAEVYWKELIDNIWSPTFQITTLVGKIDEKSTWVWKITQRELSGVVKFVTFGENHVAMVQ